MPQKPVYLDEQGNPVESSYLDENGNPITEGPTIERALSENKDPNAGGVWTKKGLTTQWTPAPKMVQDPLVEEFYKRHPHIGIENDPHTSGIHRVFSGMDTLIDQAHSNYLDNPVAKAFPELAAFGDRYVMNPQSSILKFLSGIAEQPDTWAAGAGLLGRSAATPWIERISADAIKGPEVSAASQPTVRALLPELAESSPKGFVVGPDIPKPELPPPTYIAGTTGKAALNPNNPYGPEWKDVANTVNRGEKGKFLPARPVYSNQGQALPGVETLPTATPGQDLADLVEAHREYWNGKYNEAAIAKDTVEKGISKPTPTPTPIPEPPKAGDEYIKNLFDQVNGRNDITAAEKALSGRALGKILAGRKPTRNEFNLLGHVYGRDEMTRIVQALPEVPETKINYIADRVNLPRAIQSSFDLSAPFRQGVGLIHKSAWWSSWDDMVRSFGSEKTYEGIMDSIRTDEMFKPQAVFEEVKRGNKLITIPRVKPSYAEEAGLALTDLSHISSREEAIMSGLAEKIPLGIGKGIRASNRAYTAFLNKLRSDTFKSMIKDARTAYATSKSLAKTPEEIAQIELMNPDTNLVLRKGIAEYINSASGRGSLGNLEKHATLLNSLFYSPRLIASRVNMVKNLAFAPSGLRKEYWKSMGALAGMWATTASLGAWAGADISLNPTNSDFMKIKFGNTRLDPGAGFLQYMVLLSRLGAQRTTSSTTNETYTLNSKYKGDTTGDVVRRFAAGKLNPVLGEAHDWMWERKEYQPFDYADRAAKLVTPFIIQDITDQINEDPDYLPLIVPELVGMGLSAYDREHKATFFGHGGAIADYNNGW